MGKTQQLLRHPDVTLKTCDDLHVGCIDSRRPQHRVWKACDLLPMSSSGESTHLMHLGHLICKHSAPTHPACGKVRALRTDGQSSGLNGNG